jgi:two-component system sensor histidine kinase/response regulator
VDSRLKEFCVPVMAEREQPKSVLILPLLVDNRLWGLLVAHQCSSQRRWRKNEIAFLYHVAEYLAIAIFQARSYQELQEQKIHLESLALQRSRELEDALLSAKIASQSKKEFIHIMSHELLTPLTSIIGLSNTLSYWSAPENLNKLSAEKRQSYLKTIQESGLKLRNLLQDILDFSQTEAARTILDIQQFSLKQLCYAVINSFQEMGDRQGLTLRFINNLEPEQELFCADPARLEKILNHLIANAIKFTPHGGEVTFTIWRENQKDVIFQIKDTGIGIPPQQMPLLFEKFQQLEPSISRSHDGAGFGLALVKQIVETHRGQIHVTSTPKKGSIFTVRIPCQQLTEQDIAQGELIPVKNNGSQGRTIVLISQDEEVAMLICDLLTATNYQVIWLVDSIIALSQVTVLQPVLVIVDAQQQDRPIEKIIKGLRTMPQTQHIPYLLVSDPLPHSVWSQLQKQGCQDYIKKPIQSEILINRVNNYVLASF